MLFERKVMFKKYTRRLFFCAMLAWAWSDVDILQWTALAVLLPYETVL